MTTRPTLAQIYAPRVAELRAMGKSGIAEMSEHFTKCADMDRALGYNNCVAHWLAGRNDASNRSEMLAQEWLAKRKQQQQAPVAIAATIPASGDLLLVACPAGQADRVKKVLALLNCETTDI